MMLSTEPHGVNPPPNQGGFSLIELMVAIAVMGIALALAIPNFQVMNANAKVRGHVTQLQELFGSARSLAITSQRNVDVIRTSTTWQIKTPSDGVVRQNLSYATSDNFTETLTTTPSGLTGDNFRFTPTGFLQHVNGGTVQAVKLTVSLCVSGLNGEVVRTVEIGRTGLSRNFTSTCT